MNVICRGPLGSGKTTCVRAIFSEIEALTSRFSRSMFRDGLRGTLNRQTTLPSVVASAWSSPPVWDL